MKNCFYWRIWDLVDLVQQRHLWLNTLNIHFNTWHGAYKHRYFWYCLRYIKFFKTLLNSKSPEVALVANLVSHDVQSTTGNNLARMKQETGLNPWTATPSMVKTALINNEVSVPEEENWRLPLLEKLLLQRHEMEYQLQDVKEIQSMIDSLCST